VAEIEMRTKVIGRVFLVGNLVLYTFTGLCQDYSFPEGKKILYKFNDFVIGSISNQNGQNPGCKV
jgi:hypothetical protein